MAYFKTKNAEAIRSRIAKKESATVIAAGSLVGVTAGYIVTATASHTKVAISEKGAAAGVTDVEISVGNEFTLVGTGDAVFAIAQKGTDVDVVVNSTVQQIDVGTSSTLVLTIQPGTDSGVVGSASNIEVRIKKPIDA